MAGLVAARDTLAPRAAAPSIDGVAIRLSPDRSIWGRKIRHRA
jgi:hypothetical protein